MKPKQLAIVLIKMWGLFICLYAIIDCVSNVISPMLHPSPVPGIDTRHIGNSVIIFVIQAAVGIALIAMSRMIAGWMCKSDEGLNR